MAALKAYSFPGNVRELENILERATALCNENTVVLDDLQLAPTMAVSGSRHRGVTHDFSDAGGESGDAGDAGDAG
jgi:two-component system response regulator PilR (NtrC family)